MWRVSCLLGWIALCSQTILCAPAPAHDIASGVFRAGAAKVDITPALGVSLDGPISKNGPTKAVHDPLHARALVLDDGATRLVIVVCDACVVGRDVFDAAKARIERAIQLPASHMLMAATHSHAAVRAVHIGRTPQDDAYHRVLAESITEAVFAACRNLAPARIAFTSFEKPDLVKCRRFVCNPATVSANPFGETDELIKSVAGTSTAILRPAGPTDPEVSIVAVQHADGTPLALLANYSVHYAGGQQRGVVSADYFGYFDEAIERQLGSAGRVPPYVAIMSHGTRGATSAMASCGTQYERFELMQVAGREMARAVLAQIESVSYDHAIELAARESRVSFDVRQPDAARLAWAEEVLANPSSGALPHRMA